MPYNADQIKHTLAAILHAQGETVAAELLDVARAEVVYQDHDFNTDIYRLNLRIPAVRFAQIDKVHKQTDRLEQLIQEKVWRLGVDSDGEQLSHVRILPELVAGAGAVSVALPTLTDEKRIWKGGRLRLFLSHLTKIKVETSALKAALAPYGIDCFVAHEDIEPTQEWLREIELALRSMHALCAIITNGFIESSWCDQEVGYALGRAVPVVLIRAGADPYGLMGKSQALTGDLSRPSVLATGIFDVLLKQEHLRPLLTDGLVDFLVNAINYATAREAAKRVAALEPYLSKDQILGMLVAVRDNDQVRDATGVRSKIEDISKRAKIVLPVTTKPVSQGEFDDDIPF